MLDTSIFKFYIVLYLYLCIMSTALQKICKLWKYQKSGLELILNLIYNTRFIFNDLFEKYEWIKHKKSLRH